jgi:hypothetical protein
MPPGASTRVDAMVTRWALCRMFDPMKDSEHGINAEWRTFCMIYHEGYIP